MTAIIMEDKPTTTVIQTPEVFRSRREPGIRKQVVYFCLGIIVVLLVTITVFEVLKYRKGEGSQDTRDQRRLVNEFTFNVGETGEKVHERVEVTDTEEIITTEKAKLIFDFKCGFVVTKFLGARNEGVCYVAKFNNSQGIEDVAESFGDKKQITESDDLITVKENYERTNETVNQMFLSKSAQEMCVGSKVFIVRKSDVKDNPADRKKKSFIGLEDNCVYYNNDGNYETCFIAFNI